MAEREPFLLSCALQMAADGMPVFPLRPHTKVPAIERWPQQACTDPDTIRAWWARSAFNPLTGLRRDTPRCRLSVACLIARTSRVVDVGGRMAGVGEADLGDFSGIELVKWGRVVPGVGPVAWRVVDEVGRDVEPIAQFLRDFTARGNRPGSVRSYAYALLRWWRWLRTVDVSWERATSAEVRDFVLWLAQARTPRAAARTTSSATAGTINPVTGKRHLGDLYEPRTVRHSNAVLRTFYDYWIEIGAGPLVNPIAVRGRARPNAHHDPLQPYRADRIIRYNPKIAKRRPRAIPDQRWNELFVALGSHRDRAIAALAVGNGARAGELLGLRAVDLDWGEQLVHVIRKGSRAGQWLPASAEALVWLRLYLAELGPPLDPNDPLWWTLRRRNRGSGLVRQPLNYEALRAVFRRLNAHLGANYSMHDLRHTAALRMSRDEQLSMRDVQTILGHAHLATTAEVYLVEDDAAVLSRVHAHLIDRHKQAELAPPPLAAGYSSADLTVLFGSDA